MDLGPAGPKVIVQLAFALVVVVAMLLVAPRFWESRGPGVWALFPVVFVGQFVVMIVRSIRSARSDLAGGWRE